MAAFSSLPVETLTQILTPLSCADLASTARLTHRLNDITVPLLYKAPVLVRRRTPTPSTTSPTHRARPALYLFHHTILNNAGLAAYVISLYVEWESLSSKNPKSTVPADSEQPRPSPATPAPITSSPGRQLIHLVHYLHRLELLHLDTPNNHSSFTGFLECFRDPPPARTPSWPVAFQSLREFRVTAKDPDTAGYRARSLRALFRFPKLETVDIPMVISARVSPPSMGAAAATSSLKRLRMKNASNDYHDNWALPYILAVPIALTHFWYSPTALNGNFAPARVMYAIACLKDTLQFLYLDFAGVCQTDSDEENEYHDPYTSGSLRDWKALRTLNCSLLPLLGGQKEWAVELAEVLPTALSRWAVLADQYWEYRDVVERMVGVLQERVRVCPGLKSVAVKWWAGERIEERKLRGVCEEVGVEFVEGAFEW